MRRRNGVVYNGCGIRKITCIITGEMSDGTKVWTECDKDKNPINVDKQYTLHTKNGLSEFIPM